MEVFLFQLVIHSPEEISGLDLMPFSFQLHPNFWYCNMAPSTKFMTENTTEFKIFFPKLFYNIQVRCNFALGHIDYHLWFHVTPGLRVGIPSVGPLICSILAFSSDIKVGGLGSLYMISVNFMTAHCYPLLFLNIVYRCPFTFLPLSYHYWNHVCGDSWVPNPKLIFLVSTKRGQVVIQDKGTDNISQEVRELARTMFYCNEDINKWHVPITRLWLMSLRQGILNSAPGSLW